MAMALVSWSRRSGLKVRTHPLLIAVEVLSPKAVHAVLEAPLYETIVHSQATKKSQPQRVRPSISQSAEVDKERMRAWLRLAASLLSHSPVPSLHGFDHA